MQPLTRSQTTNHIWLAPAFVLQDIVESMSECRRPIGDQNRCHVALQYDIDIAVDNPAQHATTLHDRTENPQEPHRATPPHPTEKRSILLLRLFTGGTLLQRMLPGLEPDIDAI